MDKEEEKKATEATLSPDGGKTRYTTDRATFKTKTTESGEILQEGTLTFALHTALPLILQTADIQDGEEEKKKRLEIAAFFNKYLTQLDIIPGTGKQFEIKYQIGGSGEETQEEVAAKSKEYLQHPAVEKILTYFANQLREKQGLIEREKKLKEREKKLEKEERKKKHTKIAIHAASQFFGDNKQLSLFSDEKIDAFSRATGLSITNRPDSYGVVLNQAQRRVLEGIIKAFSDSNYSGDQEFDKATYSSKIHPINKMDGAYSNVDRIPVVKLTQAEVLELSGYNLKSQRQGDKIDVIEAISFLATKQFCFYWVRSKTDKGRPVKDKRGDYVKEEVMEVGSLFRIKTVRSEAGELQYYEIHPSAPLLDQVKNYFLLVPNDWREEVKKLTGKRASSYTYELLLWLRLQYEHIRRYNYGKNRTKKPFKISKSWEEVAIALKMPETMYKANRKRASKIIQEAYSVAIKLGYLVNVENTGAVDILYLNEAYYPKTGKLV